MCCASRWYAGGWRVRKQLAQYPGDKGVLYHVPLWVKCGLCERSEMTRGYSEREARSDLVRRDWIQMQAHGWLCPACRAEVKGRKEQV
jgi:hypothetical protein